MSTQPQTLMIIEDEELLLELLVDEFQSRGVRCLAASKPADAIRLLATEQPDAILSDINMPEMTGLEFLKVLRDQGIETPLIFLSGYGDRAKVTEALRLGAFDFLDKPFDRAILRESVFRALSLGVELRTLEAELNAFMAQANLTGLLEERFRKMKRTLLISKKHNNAFFKRSA